MTARIGLVVRSHFVLMRTCQPVFWRFSGIVSGSSGEPDFGIFASENARWESALSAVPPGCSG